MADEGLPPSLFQDRANGSAPAAAAAAPPLLRRPASPLSVVPADHAPVFRALPPQNAGQSLNIALLRDVELTMRIELGRAKMRLEDVLRLGPGAVVELDRLAGDPVDIFVNDHLIARGEVVVLNDKFAVRLTEVASPVQQQG